MTMNSNHKINMDKVKILQFNIQSFRTNKNYIEFFVNKNKYDIVILAEIFSENIKNSNKLINFNLIQKFRPDGYGGVAIALRKQIKFSKIPFETEQDILIVKTTNLARNYVVASIYFPPSTPFVIFVEEMTKLASFLERFDNVILCGDFNARNTCWGDHVTSRKGKELEIIMLESGFVNLNNGDPTFEGRGTSRDLYST